MRPLFRDEQNTIIRSQLGPGRNTWKAFERYVHRVVFPVSVLRQMVVECVVHLQGVIQWLQAINEVRCPIGDVNEELFIIEPATPAIVDPQLDLVQANVRKLDSFNCDGVTLRDSLGDEVGWGHKVGQAVKLPRGEIYHMPLVIIDPIGPSAVC
jgi:hypothetical protein